MNQQALPQSQIELVAIINSFNRRELLEKAIASLTQVLRKATFGSAIIVFDAGSNDGGYQRCPVSVDYQRSPAPGRTGERIPARYYVGCHFISGLYLAATAGAGAATTGVGSTVADQSPYI